MLKNNFENSKLLIEYFTSYSMRKHANLYIIIETFIGQQSLLKVTGILKESHQWSK